MSFSVEVHVQLATNVWTDISLDLVSKAGLRIKYGISGWKPEDCVADSGSLEFTLNNMANNTGAKQGYYSPLHANVRSGWTYDIPCRAVFYDSADASQSVSSITRASSTATVTTGSAHGRSTGDWVLIAGASQSEYNGLQQVTVTSSTAFTFVVSGTPTTPATGTITARRAYIKHRGRLYSIDPDAGRYASQQVHVVSYDGMRNLHDAEVRQVGIQQNKREDELISAALNSIDSHDQPIARSFDVGLDSYPYAFQDIGSGTKAAGAIQNACVSSYGLFAMKGDGTSIFKSRKSRVAGLSSYTFTDNDLVEFDAPSTLDDVYNVVRLTIHPTDVDATPTTVLYQDTGTTPRSLEAGQSITIWVDFRSPTESKTLIGAINVVNPPVLGTDYYANSQADGLGSNLSAFLTITVSPFATTAKIVLSNIGTSAIYFADPTGQPRLQLRGQGIFDLGPQTYEATSAGVASTKPLQFSLPYQNNPRTAQSYATYLAALRGAVLTQPQGLSFKSSQSNALTTQGLKGEPCDIVTVSETMTGYSGVTALVMSVEIEVRAGSVFTCHYGLAPASLSLTWLLGIAGSSELGSTTVLVF